LWRCNACIDDDLQESAMQPLIPTLPTVRPWPRRVIDSVLDRLLALPRDATDLHDLDARTLADLGIHPSELGSIEAEAQGRFERTTRRRIVAAAGGV
jgi:hypothetical protein